MRQKIWMKKLCALPPAIWILLALMIYFRFQVDTFFSVSNLRTFLITAAPLLIVSFGQTFVILTQGTDLSVGSTVSMISVLWVVLMREGMAAFPAAALSVLAGVLAGVLNGVLISQLKIAPFIATLGTQNIFSSVALVLSGNTTVSLNRDIFARITYDCILFVPISIWLAVLMFALSFVMLKKTPFGMKIIALGGNSEALKLAGGNPKSNLIKTYAFAGFMAGVAGILMACRVGSGNPLAGSGTEFNSIAAVLLGGTSLRNGNGTIVGTIFGVFLIQVVKTGLNQSGVDSIYQNAIIGGIVLLAIIVDAFSKRMRDE